MEGEKTIDTTANVDSTGSASDMHVPDMNIRDDGDYDVSTMAALTEVAEEGEDDGFDDASGDVSEDHEEKDVDDSSSMEDDAGEEETDDFETETDDVEEESVSKDEITFKVDGKEQKIPEDAEVEIKINGKKENLTLREALNNASGNIHVGREINRVKNREHQLEQNISSFREQTAQVEANAKALMEIHDPYELCEYICDLKGGDPDQLFNDMLRTTAEYADKYSKMTPRELEMERKLRRYERQERQKRAKEEVQQKTQQKTQQETELKSSLQDSGFTMDDFLKTVDELVELNKNGESPGFGLDEVENITNDDIVDYMVAKDLDNRVSEGISSINESLLDDSDFVAEIKKVVIGTELLHGEKMTQAEVSSFIKAALKKSNKALSESLTRKVKKAESKKVNSREQEDEDEGPQTLEDLHESLRNLGSFR